MEDQEMINEALKIKINTIADRIHNDVVINRRHLHSNPELSFNEYETSNFVASKLNELGIEFQKMGNTGLVALIKGDLPSNAVVVLRADLDALPITEANDVPYKSKKEGVMHSCGHDVHTSSLLGTAQILTELRNEFGGTIKLIFQPAEEIYPGGASMMIKEGVLENPKPQAIIGQHVMPDLETGKVGFCPGKYMASNDEIYLTIHGKGGHGAQPHENVDPVVIASHIIIALQQIVSRLANPKYPSVLSFGKVCANGSVNVIPDEVYMEGTFRTMDEIWREKAHQSMKKMTEGIAISMGATCTFKILKGYPFLINEERLTKKGISLPGEPCRVAPYSDWTNQEKWVWKRVCEREPADFNTVERYGGNLKPNEPEGWPLNRQLRVEFLETILSHEPYRSAIPRQGVQIVGAWFREPFNLTGLKIDHLLLLNECRFDKDVNLVEFQSTSSLLLRGSTFNGGIDMSGMQLAGDFDSLGSRFKSVDLRAAKIGRVLLLNDTIFDDTLRTYP